MTDALQNFVLGQALFLAVVAFVVGAAMLVVAKSKEAFGASVVLGGGLVIWIVTVVVHLVAERPAELVVAHRLAALVWLVSIPLVAYVCARLGARSQVAKLPKTYADVDGFVAMLMAACDDAGINDTLEQLLSQPDARRRDMLRVLIDNLREERAPAHLIDALICLQDDAVAEKAYAAIHQCPRPLAAA
jgi:hypothetical protein